MSRFFVPAVLVALVSGLALGMIGGIVARSPETHANVRPAGYDRTTVGYVGELVPYEGIGLADSDADDDPDPVVRGRILFLAYGCATCHGVAAQGGIVGPRLHLDDIFKEDFVPIVRSGPAGMPAFTDSILSDVDLDSIYKYLRATAQASFTP